MKNIRLMLFCAGMALLTGLPAFAQRSLEEENAVLRYRNDSLQMVIKAYLEQVDALTDAPRPPKMVKQPPVLFSDMVLCYGGSPSRGDLNRWDTERFAASVTYTDPKGKEHWLYDGFLAIEPRLFGRDSEPVNVVLSQEDMGGWHQSGRKEHWQELIDYWMAPDNGLACLEEAIAQAARRIGEPPYKRKVVMNLPDAVLHQVFEDLHSPTVYWGEADGRTLDFSKPEDRAAAAIWFIDTMNEAFRKAGFKYLDLIGYYVHSEEIPTIEKGWRWAWKKIDLYLPEVSRHLHRNGQYLTWIPYREAASYDRTERLGLDYVWMQPNYYWEGDRYPWEGSMRMIMDNGLGMEFEFDDRLLAASDQHEEQRRRFYLYIDYARSSGLYGKRSFTYFQDHDTMRNLLRSDDPSDRQVYDDLCQFIIQNPLRRKVKK